MKDLPWGIRRIIFDCLPKSERCVTAVQAVQNNDEESLFFLEMCGDVDNDKTIEGQYRFWASKDMIPIAQYGWQENVRGLNFDCVLFWFGHSFQVLNGCLNAEMHFVTDKIGIRNASADKFLCAIIHWFFPKCSFRHSIFLQKRLRAVLDFDVDECQVPDCLCHANIKRETEDAQNADLRIALLNSVEEFVAETCNCHTI